VSDGPADQLISEAAELLHVSERAFVTDAARQSAERVVARADTTLRAPEIFGAMMTSLDVPDESSELETLSMLPRHICR
jgi:uncharacterized protein (DUF1778 family)